MSKEISNLKSPKTPKEWVSYYDLRWRVLRKPLGFPVESARDELDDSSFHSAIFVDGKAVACGRIHEKEPTIGQIRFMAVDPEYQGQGLGYQILGQLECQASKLGFETLSLNARDSALNFYKKAGYNITGDGPFVLNIQHKIMEKKVPLTGAQ